MCAAAIAAAAALPSACSESEAPPRAQWVIEVQTDAPIPLVGDRVLIELLDSTRVLARRDATAARAQDWKPLSFGVEATSREIYLRTRLYRADHIDPKTGQPDPATGIDNLVKLPPLGDGITNVFVALRLACLGHPATFDSDAGSTLSTCVDGSPNVPPPQAQTSSYGLEVNSSQLLGVVKTQCQTPADPSMVCVPGGVFFLGSGLAPAPHSDVQAAPVPERLVGIHSMLMDRYEVTLGEFAAFVDTFVDPDTSLKLPICDKQIRCTDPGLTLQKYCTFPPGGSPNITDPTLPINCVAWSRAAQYCRFKGKRLPTEAEWEYAARNGSLDTRFPWGDDTPTCELAVLARNFADTQGLGADTAECTGTVPPGPAPISPALFAEIKDQTLSWGTGTDDRIYDLAGNVSEWTLDMFDKYGTGSTCWNDSTSVILIPAHCKPVTLKEDRTVRGGSWREPLQAAWSANRAHQRPVPVLASPDIGFRCACTLDPSSGACVQQNEP